MDNFVGIQIFSYDGKTISSPKYSGLRPEYLTPQVISLSPDLLAIKDRTDEKLIHIFDIKTGSAIGESNMKHSADILEIALNQSSSSVGRQLAVLDKNRELSLTLALKPNFKKIGTMVETIAWNDESDTLAALTDGKLVVWYYPNVMFIDEDIAPLTRLEKDAS